MDKAQIDGILGEFDSLAGHVSKSRAKEASAKISFEAIQDEYTRMIQAKTLAFASDPDIAGAVDPRTGRTNEKWAQLLTEQKLYEDNEYLEVFSRYQNAQRALFEAQVDVFNISDRIGMAKAKANLLAAYMQLENAHDNG